MAETVKHIRVVVVGVIGNKVIIPPTLNPNVGFFTEGATPAEDTYSGVYPQLDTVEYDSNKVNYAATGLSNTGLPAYLYVPFTYQNPSRTFTISDGHEVPGATAFVFDAAELTLGTDPDTSNIVAIHLLNADGRVIGKRVLTNADSEATGVSIEIDDHYLHCTPEEQGYNVIELQATGELDPPYTTQGRRDSDVWKITVPAGGTVNLFTRLDGTAYGVYLKSYVYDSDGVLIDTFYYYNESSAAHGLPLSPVEKTYYLFSAGGNNTDSRSSAEDDFIVYMSGKLTFTGEVYLSRFEVVPLEIGDAVTVMGSLSLLDTDTTPAIHWQTFTVTTTDKPILIDVFDTTDFSDVSVCLYDSVGQVIENGVTDVSTSTASIRWEQPVAGEYFIAIGMSPSYDQWKEKRGFAFVSGDGGGLGSYVTTSVAYWIDPFTYVNVAPEDTGATISLLDSTVLVLKDTTEVPFDRTFKLRAFNFGDGVSRIRSSLGFRRRVYDTDRRWTGTDPDVALDLVEKGLGSDEVMTTAGEWVDIAFDDAANAFQVIARGGVGTDISWAGGFRYAGGHGIKNGIIDIEYLDGVQLHGSLLANEDKQFYALTYNPESSNGKLKYLGGNSEFKVTLTATVKLPRDVVFDGQTTVSVEFYATGGGVDYEDGVVATVPIVNLANMPAGTDPEYFPAFDITSTGIISCSSNDVLQLNLRAGASTANWIWVTNYRVTLDRIGTDVEEPRLLVAP